jgi:hypothetical protein
MPFQATEFNETGAQFSPDGHWIAYDSDESGRYEVYVREFSFGSDGKPEATGKHQIFERRGRDPALARRRQGADLGVSRSAEIISFKPVFESSPPRVPFQLPSVPSIPPAVASDGKKFLAAVPVVQSGPQQFTVVLNWQAALKK